MKKLLLILLIVVLIAAVALFVFMDNIAKSAIEKGIGGLGVPLKIGKVSINIPETVIDVKNITIYNPKGFKGKILAEIPELYIDFTLKGILKKDFYFPEIKFDLSKLYVEKTEDGKINLEELKINGEKKTETSINYNIDTLILTLGHVKAVDYSKGKTPEVIEADLGINNEVFKNVNDIDTIVKIVIHKVVASKLFGKLGIAAVDVAALSLGPAGLIGLGAFKLTEKMVHPEHKDESAEEITSPKPNDIQPEKEE